MNVSLYQAASAMNAGARWQEVTAENLAASQIPGFKRQEISFSPYVAGLSSIASPTDPSLYLPKATVRTDFSPAGFRATSVDTDVAIDGKGFFAVQLPSGDIGYTRDGEFHRTASGELVTKQGFPVLDENGPVQLDPTNPNLFISPSGDISQGSDLRGKLRIANIERPEEMTQVGAGLFVQANGSGDPGLVPSAVVRQGFLELSNSNPVSEMTHMISAMRMFEMNQRVVQSQDERMGRTITELSPQG